MSDQAQTPEYVDVELTRGVTINGTLVKTIRMREPTVSDQLVASKHGAPEEQELTMYSNLCGVTPVDLHKLTARDYKRLQKAYQRFFDPEDWVL